MHESLNLGVHVCVSPRVSRHHLNSVCGWLYGRGILDEDRSKQKTLRFYSENSFCHFDRVGLNVRDKAKDH